MADELFDDDNIPDEVLRDLAERVEEYGKAYEEVLIDTLQQAGNVSGRMSEPHSSKCCGKRACRILLAMKSDDLVVVSTFPTVIDAEIAKSALDAADVDSFVQSDDAGGMRPHLGLPNVRLIVRAEDAQRAADILKADMPSETDSA